MSISLHTRFAILRRDRFTCQYCGAKGTSPDTELEVDHIVPVSKGGSDDPANLRTCCFLCNRGKRDHEAAEWTIRDDAEQLAGSLQWYLREASTFLVEELFGVEDVAAEMERGIRSQNTRILDYPRKNVRLAVRWVKSGELERVHFLPFALPETTYGKVMYMLGMCGHDMPKRIEERLAEIDAENARP